MSPGQSRGLRRGAGKYRHTLPRVSGGSRTRGAGTHLLLSGQSAFYEASDYATAICAAEAYDVFLRTRNASVLAPPVRLSERLGVTMADRKRGGMELTEPEVADGDEDAADAAVIDWHTRLRRQSRLQLVADRVEPTR